MTARQVLDFRPVRLQEAVRWAIELHPGTSVAPARLSEDGFVRLRERVAKTSGSPDRLESLAAELTPREVRALVSGLIQWEDLREPVAWLLRRRARPQLLPLLWRAWQRDPVLAPLRSVLLNLAAAFGWEQALASDYADVAPGWVGAEDPGAAIQTWLDREGLSYRDCGDLAGGPFLPDTPLLRLVRDAVMTQGSRAQLTAEGHDRLLRWMQELPAESKRIRFGWNYLSRLSPRDWHLPILQRIADTYGLPRRGMRRFWEPVPADIQEAFQRLFIRRRLKEALGHDTDRHAYWRRWEDDLVDVQLGVAGSVPYATLHFGTFGVVEFFEVGHAAYFYPEPDLARIAKGLATNPNDLKIRSQPSFARGDDNRLVHRGAWDIRANRMVRLWRRATAGARSR